MLATPLGSGVQPASLAAQFQDRKSSTRFTGVVGDMRQHVSESGFWGDAVRPGRSNEPLHGGRVFAAAVGAGEQEVALAQGNAAQSPLGGRVVDLDTSIVCIAGWATDSDPSHACCASRRLELQRMIRTAPPILLFCFTAKIVPPKNSGDYFAPEADECLFGAQPTLTSHTLVMLGSAQTVFDII